MLAVRVRNEGRNSRWYSGSGIYRHVWLTTTNPIHVPMWGLFVTTPEVSKDKAIVKVATDVRNSSTSSADVLVRVRVRDTSGKVVGSAQAPMKLEAGETASSPQTIPVPAPKLWSPAAPNLYVADVQIMAAGRPLDAVSTTFGIRRIELDAEHGFRLNGESIKLKGACVHHDNGPLGAAAIDRAEERRVELLKANGFNAIRCAHNPRARVSRRLRSARNARDRRGLRPVEHREGALRRGLPPVLQGLVLARSRAMVLRDRNHPSVVMWSVGNEIPEQFRDGATGLRLRKEVLALDTTRPITQAVCTDWGKVVKNWDELSDPAFPHLDVAGYNYLPEKYEGDHARHPDRVILTTESLPKDLLQYWSLVEKHPYVIGDFVWSGIDYLGESGIGHNSLSNEKESWFMHWPWFDAWCGDLDILRDQEAAVVLSRCRVAAESDRDVRPRADSAGAHREAHLVGWPEESPSWNWSGQEGRPLQVTVYSRCERVRLVLNAKVVGEQPVSEATKLAAKFDVPYEPGELRAFGLDHSGKSRRGDALEDDWPGESTEVDRRPKGHSREPRRSRLRDCGGRRCEWPARAERESPGEVCRERAPVNSRRRAAACRTSRRVSVRRSARRSKDAAWRFLRPFGSKSGTITLRVTAAEGCSRRKRP